MRNLHKILITLLIMMGIMIGCNSAPEDQAEPVEDSTETETVEEEAESTEDYFPVTVEDSNGDEITLDEQPESIVSLMPSNTEIAFALGLGDEIVGVSEHDNYPEEALEKEQIGGLELNVEAILALEPDLVFAHPGNDPDAVEQLKDADLNVFVVNDATNFDEVYESIEMMGEISGKVAEGEEIIETMQTDLAELEEKAAEISEGDEKTVYIEISPEPEIYTPGQGTFEDDILSLIRAENAAGDEEGWVMISEEAVVDMNPDVIILTYDYVENAVDDVLARDAWQDITAVKDEQVFEVDTDLVSRPGPRLVEGAETLAKEIYPEVFAE